MGTIKGMIKYNTNRGLTYILRTKSLSREIKYKTSNNIIDDLDGLVEESYIKVHDGGVDMYPYEIIKYDYFDDIDDPRICTIKGMI